MSPRDRPSSSRGCETRQRPSPPIPALLAGAGATLPRGAGPNGPHVLIDDDQPLLAAIARMAAGAFADELAGPGATAGGALRFVGAHGLEAVALCPLGPRRSPGACARARAVGVSAPAATFVYVAGDPLAAQLHRLHGCADEALVLVATGGGGAVATPPPAAALEAARLTPREVDVLALLLARRDNREIADLLVVSVATVRSHCRAVLRKLACRDRRELRRVWAAGAPCALAAHQVRPRIAGSQSCPHAE